MNKQVLLDNIAQIHTTSLGMLRIQKVIDSNDCISVIKSIINDRNSVVKKEGKNYYVYYESLIITINSFNYCIITAKKR